MNLLYPFTHILFPSFSLLLNVGENYKFFTGEEKITKNFKNSKDSFFKSLYKLDLEVSYGNRC